MPKMSLNRKHTLRSLTGHIIAFERDKPVFVPPMLVSAAKELGATIVEGEDDVVETEDEVIGPTAAPEGEARKQLIVNLMEKMIARNARDDFNASGRPALKVLNSELGFTVKKAEADLIWEELQAKE